MTRRDNRVFRSQVLQTGCAIKDPLLQGGQVIERDFPVDDGQRII